MLNDRFLSAALDAVSTACQIARIVQNNLDGVRKIVKDDNSPVTVADYAVQAVIAMILTETLGSSLIVGEETTGQLRAPERGVVLDAVVTAVRNFRPTSSARDVLAAIDMCDHDATSSEFWTLDPIDGTKGFLRGQQYAIALARIEDGHVVLGVMGCPNLPRDGDAPLEIADPEGSLYAALRGGGAWEHHLCSPTNPLRRLRAEQFHTSSRIRACESVESAHSKQDDTARILGELGTAGNPARLDSQCKYAVVARGQADAYLRLPTKRTYIEKIWDHAAGAILASEAGAVVSDITGANLDFGHGRQLEANRGIVCASVGLHDRIIEVIERLGIGAAV